MCNFHRDFSKLTVVACLLLKRVNKELAAIFTIHNTKLVQYILKFNKTAQTVQTMKT